jgi:hypothetical protein
LNRAPELWNKEFFWQAKRPQRQTIGDNRQGKHAEASIIPNLEHPERWIFLPVTV